MKKSKHISENCQEKFCKNCQTTKPLNEFYKRLEGVSSYCKECTKDIRKSTAKLKKESEIKQIIKDFNPETFKVKGKILSDNEKRALKHLGYRWCASCKTPKIKEDFYPNQSPCKKCSELNKKKWEEKNPNYYIEYREKNKQKQSEAHRKWFLENKEKKNKQNREWYYKNKERHIKRGIQNAKKRMIKNPSERVAKNLRQRMRNTIVKGYKSASTIELLGCSFEDCRKHLEAQWQEGMTWDNYGIDGWHIDHIKPCASFDLTDPKQQAECFHYTNLQPLWAIDNIKKSDS